MKSVVVIFLLMLCPYFVDGQVKCKQVLLTGKVQDSLNPQAFYNLMIINRSTGKGVFGQPNGQFTVYASEKDSISISVKGYPLINLRIKADSNCQHIFLAQLDPLAVQIKEIVIEPLKTLAQIKEERLNLSLRETRQVTGIESLSSPITALYQTFSKKEKNKRWIAEQEYKDDQTRIVKELLRLYVAFDIVDLTEDEFDDFILFLNINEDFLKTATEMELVTFIKDKYEHYKLLNNLLNRQEKVISHLQEKLYLQQQPEQIIQLFLDSGLIDLPENELSRFIQFVNLKESFLKTASKRVVINYVLDKYQKYLRFYKLNPEVLALSSSISQYDTYLWRSELACPDNKDNAVLILIAIYQKNKILHLDDSEINRFITFLNISENFMKKATDAEILSFIEDKYQKYLEFYKVR